ncbi:MAG: secondary thiamine-phosphate synthase enzyme YjbQ [Candidatus Pacearchaeota archaeon]
MKQVKMIYQKEITLKTKNKIEIVDITQAIEKIIKEAKIEKGIVIINALHSTSCLILNENEQGLLNDIKNKIEEFFYKGQEKYAHNKIDDNAAAHLASSFIGQSRIYPIKDGELVRGAWQNCLFVELDGPRTRKIFVTIVGE